MAQQGGRIDFQVGFKTDKSGIQELKKSLQDIQKIKPANFEGSKKDLQEIKSTASDVEKALSKAFNPNINSINLKTFDNELKATGRSINDIYANFSKAGAQGQVAFSQMARSVLTTNQQLKETHSLINQMGTTMINTVKWGIASSIMNTFTSSVQGAFKYVEGLEKSLTNIRIVTGDSQQKMEQFADSANRAAQELGRSTMDYSKAALTFYQQGLNDEDVQARTEAVLKAQNITGAGSQMADYLTAVWNGYKVANEQAQLYVDKLAAVADSSASDMSQLAVAMSKVASTANTMGVDVDQLNAQLATVVATTRQAPQAVGTAFKTIYTRLNDIKTGSDQAQVSLGRYSGQMAELGFNVLDASGHLRDTGQVMQEIGSRWGDLTREQQIYLATTMGGQRQVNQLIALFDNWTTYSELLNTSLESEGTLVQKNSIYMESLGAKMEQLGAAGERVKASLVDSESFGNIIELLTTATNLLGGFIQSIGGGGTALLGLGGIATQVFSGVLTKEINNAIINFQNFKHNEQIIQQELARTKEFGQLSGFNDSIIKSMVNVKSEMQQYYSIMSNAQRETLNNIVNNIGQTEQEIYLWDQKIKLAEEFNKGLQDIANNLNVSLEEQQSFITDHLKQMQKELKDSFKIDLLDLGKGEGIQNLIDSFITLGSNIETSTIPGLDHLINELDAAQIAFRKAKQDFELFGGDDNEIALSAKASRVRQILKQIVQAVQETNNNSINIQANYSGLEQAKARLIDLKKEAENFRKEIEQSFNIKNIVNLVGALGQVASAISSLQNIGNIINNDNLSNGQKAIKIITALSFAVTSLTMAYGKINAALQITETLSIAQQMAQAQQTVLLGAQTTATNILTAAKIKLTAATYGLTQAMIINPYFAVIAGIGLLVAAIGTAITIYDKFNMSIKQANQALDNYDNKLKQSQSKIKQINTNITSLEQVKDEWDQLSERAGSYNKTIDNLTESEKQRYYELSNLIAEYNTAAIVGYDQQGNAIVRNNKQLENTIQLLKDKRQAQINELYGGKDAEQADKGRQKLFKESIINKNVANEDFNNSGEKLNNDLLKNGEILLKTLNQQQDQLNEQQKEEWKELNEIIDGGILSISKNRGRLIEIFKDFKDIPVFSGYYSSPFIDVDSLQKQLEDYNGFNKSLIKYTNQTQDIIEQQKQAAFQLLQTDDYNGIYQEAEELGINNGAAIVTGILDGMNIITKNGDLMEREEIVNNVNEIFSSIIDVIGQKTANGQTIYDAIVNSITMNRKIQQNDFSSLREQEKQVVNIIESILQENIESFQGLSDIQKENLSKFFAEMFNLEGVEINFDTGKVEKIINSKLDTLVNRTNETLKKAGFKVSKDWVANFLPSDVTEEELDYFTQHLAEKYEQCGDIIRAFRELTAQAPISLNFDQNAETLELLTKRANGENLSDKEQQSLETGIKTLIDTYPGLIEQVRLLNSEWLSGTSSYKDALTAVKGVLINSIAQSLKDLNEETEEYGNLNDKILNLVKTTKDYQIVSNSENISLKTKQDSLMIVASAYESCRDELEKYYQVINSEHTNEEEESARMSLERTTRSEEVGQQYGIDPNRISSLANQYARLAEAGNEAYGGLQDSAELAVEAATRYIRLNDAIADLQQNYEKVTQVLSHLKEEGGLEQVLADDDMHDTYDKIKEDLAGILDISQDMIDQDWDKWIGDNAEKIQAALEGDQQAIDALKQAAAEEVDIKIGEDVNIDGLFAKLDMAYDSVAEWGKNLPEGELTANDLEFAKKLTQALSQAGWTADQIRDIFSRMDINVDLDPLSQSYDEMVDETANAAAAAADAAAANGGLDATTVTSTTGVTDVIQAGGYQLQPQKQEIKGSLPTVQTTYFPNLGIAVPSPGENVPLSGYMEGVDVISKADSIDATKESSATGVELKSANKKSGGKVSHKNRSGGNKKSSGGGGKKGKGKKGGGKKGKSSTPKAPKVEKPVTDKQDRYHDVNLKLKETDNQLKKIQEKQNKLTGPELLKNLEKQQKLLDKQVDTYKTKLELEKQQRDEVRNRLAKQGALFDKNGNISNYSKLLSNALAEYNKTIADYNKMSAQEQEKHSDMIENAKKKYEGIKEDISRYDKIISEEIPGLQESIQKALDEKTQIEIQKFKTKVEVQVDLSEAERDFNEFQDKVKRQLRDDDVLGKGQSSIRDYNSYYKEGNDVVQALTDQIRNTKYEIDEIDQTGKSSIYGDNRAAALKDLKEYTDKLKDSLQDVEDIVANIKDSIFDAIDKAQDAFDKQEDEYEHISDLIQHNKDMIELLYGDDAYNELANFYKLQEENNKNQLDFLKQQQSLWYARLAEQKALRDALPKDSNAWKEANERVEEYEKHWMDVTKKINSTVQKSIENIIDKYSNAIDKTFKKLEDKLTKNKGLDYINEEWELINDKADMYLDKVNSMYEIDKLGNAYQEAIKNNEGNVKAQKSLNNMMNEQLKYLKDKDKLTQYDVDRANALLQIEIKRLALEQQRQSKTKLRLRRDAQGNYTYQYTADEQANEQAKQELADAENSLYNMTKEAYKNNLDTYYDTVDEWQDKVKDVYKDTTLTVEQQQKKVALLNEYYGDIITDLTKDNEDLKKFMMEDTFNEMAKMYDTNVENYKKMTQATKDTLMSDMIPYWKSGVQEMADSVKKSQQQFIPYVQGTFDELNTYYKSFQNSLKSLQQQAGITFNDLVKGVDENINRTQGLLESNKAMVDSYTKEITAVRQLITEVQQLIDTYHLAKQEALDAIQTMDSFLKEDSRRTATNTNTKMNTNTNTSKNNSGAYSMSNHAVPLKTNTTASKDAISLINNSTKRLSSFATGGYTGDWGDNGRIGILHEKELILNEEDTQNILSAVRVTRTLNSILESFKFDSSDFDIANLLRGGFMKPTESNTEQHIVINADFPSVKNTYEIEAAFDNLVNRASQFAFNNRK